MTFLSWIFSAKVEIDNIIARISKVMICLSRLFMNDFITASEGSTSVYHAPPSIINTAAQRGGVLAASTNRWHDFLFGSTHALHSVMSCCKISAHHSKAVSSRGPTLPLTELTCANKGKHKVRLSIHISRRNLCKQRSDHCASQLAEKVLGCPCESSRELLGTTCSKVQLSDGLYKGLQPFIRLFPTNRKADAPA
jgi:hypothetical protein